MPVSSTLPIMRDAIVVGLASRLAWKNDTYGVVEVETVTPPIPDQWLSVWEKPDKRPPVPTLEGYAAIVDKARVPGLKGTYSLDDRYAVILGRWEEVFHGGEYHHALVPAQVTQKATPDLLAYVFGVTVQGAQGRWRFVPIKVRNLYAYDVVSKTSRFQAIALKMADKEKTLLDAYKAYLVAGMSPYIQDKPWVELTETPWDKRFKDWMAGTSSKLPPQPFNLAMRILRELPEATTQGSVQEAVSRPLISEDVVELLTSNGYELPPQSDGSPTGNKRYLSKIQSLLLQLQNKLELRYQHEVPQESMARLRTESESDEVFDSIVSRLNPGDRKPRRPRRPRAHENPLPEQQLFGYIDWTSLDPSRRGEPPAETSELTALQREAQSWPLTRIAELLPGKKTKKADLSLRAKGPALSQLDMISRIADLGVSSEVEETAVKKPEFYREPQLVTPMVEAAELSFDTTRSILDRQRGALKGSQTVQASTALLQNIRVQRLSAYRLPPALVRAGGDKKAVIWLSPEGHPFRVMSIRRNTHVDADLIPIKGLTPVTCVSKALQAALYWLAEDPRRRDMAKGATLYIGRIGRPSLAVAWKPGQALTLEQVRKNLGRSMDGSSAAELVKLVGYNDDADIEQYVQALTKVKPSQTTSAPPPPSPTPPYEGGFAREPDIDEAEPEEPSIAEETEEAFDPIAEAMKIFGGS